MNIQKSIEAFKRAKSAIAGGVNSPVRAYSSVDSTPLFMDRGKGSKVWDIDGNEYIDFVSSYGPLILGHAHPRIVEAVMKAAEKGTSFGAPTETETEIAELVKEMVPSIERIRFVNSGTEATMSGIRLARGYTGKDYIVKFSGCFHGHGDTFLIQAGSGVMTLGLPDSPGVTKGTASDTLVAHYNDLESVQQLFDQYGDNIAGVILEPVAGNMGTVPPDPPFLKGLKEITKKHQSLLIFDEVMTGFRVAHGGAQEYYDVTPDMTILGKIIGCGIGARLCGFNYRESLTIGIATVPRAEVALILANLGLKHGVITHSLASTVIAMSMFTTLLTPIMLTFSIKWLNKNQKT
ncbi:MAG: glutamate-1-semialdehyde 2,1-aminomutase [Bacteroidota bacterium]